MSSLLVFPLREEPSWDGVPAAEPWGVGLVPPAATRRMGDEVTGIAL